MDQPTTMPELKVKILGRKPYREIWQMQRELFDEMVSLKRKGLQPSCEYLVVVEHDPVITLGRHGKESNLLVSDSVLANRGIEAIRIERGGDITYHGPGQLVAYPILDLEAHRLGIKKYVWLLEETVISLIDKYGIKGRRIEGASGVWIGEENEKPRKICALGIKSSRYITMHGLALNVTTDLKGFSAINPCGFIDRGVTSMQCETDRNLDFNHITEKFVEVFANLLHNL